MCLSPLPYGIPTIFMFYSVITCCCFDTFMLILASRIFHYVAWLFRKRHLFSLGQIAHISLTVARISPRVSMVTIISTCCSRTSSFQLQPHILLETLFLIVGSDILRCRRRKERRKSGCTGRNQSISLDFLVDQSQRFIFSQK